VKVTATTHEITSASAFTENSEKVYSPAADLASRSAGSPPP
jgi:hypothetical protein